MTLGFSPVTAPLPDRSTNSSNVSATAAPDSTNSTAPAGALQGRDPDLIFAGEKIMVNGKAYTVKDGDTLTSIAAANGTTVKALINENSMNEALLGPDAQGQYFSTTSPQPPNGGATAPPPNATNNTAPSSTAAAPTAEPQSGSSATGPKGLPANTTTRNPVDPSLEPREEKTGLQGVLIKDPKTALKVLDGDGEQPPNQVSLTPAEVDRLRVVFEFLQNDTSGTLGSDLCQEDKNLYNKWSNANGMGA
jgi:LysM repeat protein